ncbi:hypothetical protein L226DRAFT_458614 [Lentinus tigrinus ALCF2SS1-7]|uniref:uncharacterized protein n=1 Tax=Lentinus tigrinus ALCF2SS1-7 TaxID=1328758 RepID=UPI001165FE95|nr:hypothetical protein L226DRAFT_458614 [Lentinus tigrinus ALCF2SS1-7]
MVPTLSEGSFTRAHFVELWASGMPVVVSNVDRRLQGRWNPEELSHDYGSEKVFPVDCETNEAAKKPWKAKEFFQYLQNPDAKKPPMKLKDWPPSKSFRTTFSDLFDGFLRSIPASCQDIARVDGKFNLAAHYAKNGNAPDLGPKMYIATGSEGYDDRHGTTRLHLDVTDAINVLPWCADRKSVAAVWHIFDANCAGDLWQFLHDTHPNLRSCDPIHSQCVYLSDDMLASLASQYGVRPWTIHQRYGQAVFIPAGCAHQVRNLQSAIKVACDFVSIQNLDRTLALLGEQRVHRLFHQGPEDVLQLHTLLWYAWLSTCSSNNAADQFDMERIEGKSLLWIFGTITNFVSTDGEDMPRGFDSSAFSAGPSETSAPMRVSVCWNFEIFLMTGLTYVN